MGRLLGSPPGTPAALDSAPIGARFGNFRPAFHWGRTTKGAGAEGGISASGCDSPDLTFELYAQPLVSSGDYFGLMELAAPRSFDFLRYGDDVGTVTRSSDGGFTVDPDGTGSNVFEVPALDFNFRSLLGNAVLRWQWRPGSTLFLVWQQTRSQEVASTVGGSLGDDVGQFKLGRDTRALFGLEPDNVFTLKVSYWLNP